MNHLNPVLLLGLLLTACGDGKQAGSDAVKAESDEHASLITQVNPCDIVLAPLENMPANSPVSGYQRAVIAKDLPLPELEQLGWAFVSQARYSFDPAYYQLAQQTARCMERNNPHNADALLLKGHALHNLHNFREAEAIAQTLVAQRGLWFDYGLLGDALLELGRLDEAADAYQVMMDQRPGPQAYSRAAQLRWLRGDLAGAIEMMQMTVQAIGQRDSGTAVWARAQLGLYQLQAGDFENARLAINSALELRDNHATALLAKGLLFLALGDLPGAIRSLKNAVEINPAPEYQWLLIDALHSDGQLATAQVFEKELHRRGTLEDRRTYALYLATIGRDVDKALRLAEQELLAGEDVFSLDAMAWALYAADRIPEALTHSQRAVAEGTQNARLFYHAAVISHAAGATFQALDWFSKTAPLQHMLLPSERAAFEKHYAAVKLHALNLAKNQPDPQDH